MNVPVVLKLEGSPEQMGAQHGESLRETIVSLANERLDIILSNYPKATRRHVRDLALEVLEDTQHTIPLVYKESLATARAANLDHWLLLVAGGFSDISDMVAKSFSADMEANECTLWPTTGPARSLRLVGTWDSHATAQKSLVVILRKLNTGLSTLALSTAGWPLQQGVTSNGLAFAIANMVAKTRTRGTSYICALPEIVTACTTEEAADKTSALKFCSARYFAFADTSGKFVAVECDGHNSWVNMRQMPHTNHFIFDGALASEGRPEIIGFSEVRRQAATALLDYTSYSIETLFENLAVAEGALASIVQRGDNRTDRTCAVFVLEPMSGRITFTIGPPSRDNIYSVALSN